MYSWFYILLKIFGHIAATNTMTNAANFCHQTLVLPAVKSYTNTTRVVPTRHFWWYLAVLSQRDRDRYGQIVQRSVLRLLSYTRCTPCKPSMKSTVNVFTTSAAASVMLFYTLQAASFKP